MIYFTGDVLAAVTNDNRVKKMIKRFANILQKRNVTQLL
jgi:hypothetical protein